MERVAQFFKNFFRTQASYEEIAAELRARRPRARSIDRVKTLKGATHRHRPAGLGHRRRRLMPSWSRGSCRFAWSASGQGQYRKAVTLRLLLAEVRRKMRLGAA